MLSRGRFDKEWKIIEKTVKLAMINLPVAIPKWTILHDLAIRLILFLGKQTLVQPSTARVALVAIYVNR